MAEIEYMDTKFQNRDTSFFVISKVNKTKWNLYPLYGEERLGLIGNEPMQNHLDS